MSQDIVRFCISRQSHRAYLEYPDLIPLNVLLPHSLLKFGIPCETVCMLAVRRLVPQKGGGAAFILDYLRHEAMLEELYAKRDKSDTINLELLIGDEVISSEEDVPSEEAVPEGAGAQNPDVPMEETKPKDDSPKDETAKGMSKEDPPKGDAPKDDQSKDDTPKEDKPKGDTPKDDPPKDEPTKNDPPKDDPPKDDPPKDDPPKDGSPTDTPPATCGPSAPEPPKCDDIILAPCNNTGDLESLIQKYMASVQITSEPPKPPPVCKATIHVSAGPPCMMQASPLPPCNCFSAMRIVHPSCSYVDGISISASYTPPGGARVAYSNANVISYQYTHHPPYEPCERGWVFHHGY